LYLFIYLFNIAHKNKVIELCSIFFKKDELKRGVCWIY